MHNFLKTMLVVLIVILNSTFSQTQPRIWVKNTIVYHDIPINDVDQYFDGYALYNRPIYILNLPESGNSLDSLIISSVELVGPSCFRLLNDTNVSSENPIIVPPDRGFPYDDSYPLVVQFLPTTTETYTATLILTHNGYDSPTTVNLLGRGINPNELTDPFIKMTASIINFPDININDASIINFPDIDISDENFQYIDAELCIENLSFYGFDVSLIQFEGSPYFSFAGEFQKYREQEHQQRREQYEKYQYDFDLNRYLDYKIICLSLPQTSETITIRFLPLTAGTHTATIIFSEPLGMFGDRYLPVKIHLTGTCVDKKTMSTDKPTEELPTTYNLEQNYPNPFNPTTKIEYSLPEASMVRLAVYNSLGQEVASLVNEYKAAGKYIVDFNANNLPSGMYFYKIQSGNFNSVKKMMLLK